jgi:hypothetical protein
MQHTKILMVIIDTPHVDKDRYYFNGIPDKADLIAAVEHMYSHPDTRVYTNKCYEESLDLVKATHPIAGDFHAVYQQQSPIPGHFLYYQEVTLYDVHDNSKGREE